MSFLEESGGLLSQVMLVIPLNQISWQSFY